MKIEVNLDNLKVTELGKNQFVINTDGASIFQSYNSIIAIKTDRLIILDEDTWDYSRTTGKYRNIFLNEDGDTTRRKVKNKMYMLAKLN